MKIIVIGASGTIGSAVCVALETAHDVIRASRNGDFKVDLGNAASIRALFASVGNVDAIVVCAANAAFAPLAALTDDQFRFSLDTKLMGQVNVARFAQDRLNDGGSITLTSGMLSRFPMQGSSAVSLVNAGVEAFARAAALELPRRQRINAVSPGWVKETMVKLGMDPSAGVAAADVARAYVRCVEGRTTGEVLDVTG